jgi:fucose 4-O-acetylase-like acetyltransferase
VNSTLRAFLIVLAIAVVVFVLQLETVIFSLFLLARIAFFLAIAFFLYLLWRERRSDIAMWSRRARVVFYGSAILMVVNVAARFFSTASSGWDLLAFLAVFPLAGFAMWRVWKDEHSYGY